MWPFDQPENCATVTTKHVVTGGAPITRAYHDESDHGWQFHSEHATRTEDAMIVALRQIVALDSTVVEIADLPPGWAAKREAVGAPWRRELQYADATQVIVDWSKITSEGGFYDVVCTEWRPSGVS